MRVVPDVAVVVTHFQIGMMIFLVGDMCHRIHEAHSVIKVFKLEYALDGSIVSDATHDPSLVAANGAIALISTNEHRTEFINAVWEMTLLTGSSRYYMGLMSLTSMLILSGRMQVY